jgi:hypothetical protein
LPSSGFTYFTQTTTPNYITGATPTEFAGCLSLFPTSSVTAVPARDGNTDLTSITVEGPLTMWAQPITVIYRNEDVSLFALPTDMTSTIAAGPTSLSTSHPSTSTSSAASQPNKSLPGGLIGGVGTAAGIGVFLLLACVFIFARRRYRTKKEKRDRQWDNEDSSEVATAENGLNIMWPKHEKLPPPVEAPVHSPVTAYINARIPAELYSSPKLNGEHRHELGA